MSVVCHMLHTPQVLTLCSPESGRIKVKFSAPRQSGADQKLELDTREKINILPTPPPRSPTPIFHSFSRWPAHCDELNAVFLNRRAAARYRALPSIIPDHERFSWNLPFWSSKQFSWMFHSGNILRRIIFMNVSKISDPNFGLRKLQYGTRFH